jgi:hypothetical protein
MGRGVRIRDMLVFEDWGITIWVMALLFCGIIGNQGLHGV